MEVILRVECECAVELSMSVRIYVDRGHVLFEDESELAEESVRRLEAGLPFLE